MSPAEIGRRLLYLFRRDQYAAELEEEMRLHVELRAARLQGGGLNPDAARYAAKRKFGNTTSIQERSRDMWGFLSLEQLGADLKFAVRRLRNRPGFSAATIAVAALGIGATTAVFSAVDAAILRPLPFLRPAELVTLSQVNIPFEPEIAERGTRGKRELDIGDVVAMRTLFSGAAAYAAGGLNIDDPTQPRRVRAGVVTATFFPTLGVTARVGRTFTPDEGMPRGPTAVIISDALWRSYFGSGDAVGKTLKLSGVTYTVVGIMPPSFGFPNESELWIPMSVPTTFETFAPFRGYLPKEVLARLAPGVPVDAASRQLLAAWEHSIGPRRDKKDYFIDMLEGIRASGAVLPLQREIVGGDRRKALLVLMGATALLLLIACANVANLLLSDAATRQREVALREVLGASRGRVIRQLLTESVLLSLAGALIGVAVAPSTLGIMRALMPEALAGTAAVHLDLRVLGFATVLALITGVLFGLWPALGTSRLDPGETMKTGGGHGATSGRIGHTRRLLIGAELALTVMLLVGAGLMLKSFHRIVSQDFGMNPEQVGTLEVSFANIFAGGEHLRLIHTVLDRLGADPGIAAAGVVNDLPLRGGGGIGIRIEADGVPIPPGDPFPRRLMATGGYFKALGIPILRGRTFNTDDDTVGQRVAIINQAMARTFWPGTDALNRTFHFQRDAVSYTVVGIVADVREGDLAKPATPQMYLSVDEQQPANFAVVARSSLPPGILLARLTSAVRFAAPTQAVYNVRMMDAVVGKSVAPRRTNTLLISIFGALAFVLSAFGVYAVVSYSVARRSREFGIRSALGANRGDILRLVSREMVGVVTIGLAVGLLGAWAMSRVLASMLFEVPAHDVATFVTVPLALLVPAMIATLIPSMRATRINPTDVMRAE